MQNIIAARQGCYASFAHRAWAHMPQIGLKHIEVDVPGESQADELAKNLDQSGLVASTMTLPVDIKQADVAERVRPQLQMLQRFGVRVGFASVHAGEQDEATTWQRLRALGDCAAEHKVTIVMETHPNLMSNGEVAHHNLSNINHPNVRMNFDTANVHYYNRGIDTVDELKKVVDYVGAVHLKESRGGFKTWDFPSLGKGIVDFPAVFELLNGRGFYGPFTMELEGTSDVDAEDESAVLDHIAESVAYLKRIGVMA